MSDTFFAKSENQRMLEESLERYLRENHTMADRSKTLVSGNGLDRSHWSFFAGMGLLGLPFREADGGFDGTLAEVMSVMSLFGKSLVLEPYLQSIVLAGRLLAHCLDEAQKARWLPGLISGESLIGLAHWERDSRPDIDTLQARLTREGDTLYLTGDKYLVPLASELNTVLVTARDQSGNLVVCAVPGSAVGMSTRDYPAIDGHRLGDLHLTGVPVAKSDILALDDAQASLAEVITYGAACLCGEALGIMESLLDMTVEYTKTRKQFGVPISRFQVIKHRLVDSYTSLYQSRAMVDLLATESGSEWVDQVAAVSAFTCQHAIAIGHEAIQMHGGMGLTDELAVSHYHKRLTTITRLLGNRQGYMDKFIGKETFLDSAPESFTPVFAPCLGATVSNFHQEVKSFLKSNLTENLRSAVRRQVNAFPEPEITRAWQKNLAAQGWLAPHWPVELGGTGWSAMARFVYEYECGLRDAPEQVPMGFRYVGPVIAHFGSEWQKAYFLPKLLSGEHYWAQGFSEPGAGSDLAALKTTAVSDGDHYVINGSKMWTTHAHHANWLFCLARTDMGKRPQEGIGFFLIEMNSPGIRVEAIPLMTGPSEVNQVFLDDVRVPATHLVGGLTKGWDYTKFLLEFERGGAVFSGRARRELNRVKALLKAQSGKDDRVVLHQLAALEFRVMALELLEYRHATEMQTGGRPGVGGSITKLLASELRKDIAELTAQVVGCAGLEYQHDFICHGAEVPGFPGSDPELVAVSRYLNMRVESIYGGSSEIQREIIAREVLGLR